MFNRIFYDKGNGKILYQLFMENPELVTDFAVLEIPEGDINYDTHYIESIDENGHPVIKMKGLSPLEVENAELKKDVLLLQTDNQEGGVL